MTIKHRIKEIMTGGKSVKISPLVILLYFLSILYENIVRLRHGIYAWGIIKDKGLPCPVVSIGNITIGGTGKTPMTIHVARLFQQMGYNVAVISRGYKGKAENTGGVISNGDTLLMDVNDAGDEPIMMAIQLNKIPVLVGKRRFEMCVLARQKFNSDLIVLDDAFQHLKLKRDIDVVLLDSERPLGNLYMLPRGVLREPVSGLKRGDVYIMTRYDQKKKSSVNCKEGLSDRILKEKIGDKPIFKTFHTPYYFRVKKDNHFPAEKITQKYLSNDFTFLKQQNVLLFSGIAGNHYFKRTVEDIPCNISEFMDFPDHYQYSKEDLEHIVEKAQRLKLKYMITTEKDYMRMYQYSPWPIDLVVIGVKISFEDEKAFQTYMKNELKSIEKRM
jgi:tetraacyldisaccharide 4'-kinase